METIDDYKRTRKLHGHNIIIRDSTRKGKKYMIFDNSTMKYIHYDSIDHLNYSKYLKFDIL